MNLHDVDPITLSTVWHTFISTCKEMRYVVDRTCQSYLIAQLHDISMGIYDAQGRTIAVPVGLPGQFLGGKFSIRYILDKFGDNIHPGDVFLNNDPYHGWANHLPDWGFFRPIFYKDELLFFTLARGHQMDTGGAYPGGYFPDAYDIHAEGLCIPPIKVFEKGEERKDVLELIWNNVRFPEGVRVDNYAMIAATEICEKRVLAMVEKYGKEDVLACVEEMLARTEARVRKEILEIPDGTYYAEAASDDDGSVLDEQVWVRCEITVKGDHLIVDYSKSDSQRRGFVHNVYSAAYSRSVSMLFLFFDPAIAEYHNEGSMRPVEFISREGTVTNSLYPATVGGSPVSIGTQIHETSHLAMSKARPDRAVACWGRHRGHYIFGNDPRTGDRYVQTTFDADGGGGAVYGFDGYQGAATIGTLGSVNRGNVEEIEIRFPWRTLKYHFACDLEGAGKWRGASGMHWEVLNEGSEAGMATGSSDGEETYAMGVLGGEPSPFCRTYVRRGEDLTRVKSHRLFQLLPGDVLVKQSGGGAGVGNPAERDPEKVQEDVLNELVSIAKAREMYRVAIDPNTLTIDYDETKRLRSEEASQVSKP